MAARATGVRQIRNLMTLDLSKIDKNEVKANLTKMKSSDFIITPVRKNADIKRFVEGVVQVPFRVGIGFYQLMKPEMIQYYKKVCVRDRKTKAVYGGAQARQVLGLPDANAKITPVMPGSFDVFVQSTSANRSLIAGTEFLVDQNATVEK